MVQEKVMKHFSHLSELIDHIPKLQTPTNMSQVNSPSLNACSSPSNTIVRFWAINLDDHLDRYAKDSISSNGR